MPLHEATPPGGVQRQQPLGHRRIDRTAALRAATLVAAKLAATARPVVEQIQLGDALAAAGRISGGQDLCHQRADRTH